MSFPANHLARTGLWGLLFVWALPVSAGNADEAPDTELKPDAATPAPAPNPRDAFALANDAYAQARVSTDPEEIEAKLRETERYYVSIIDRGIENGVVYYNLGNTYYRLGDIGRSIWAYRRAERYLPRDRYVQSNLKFARQRRGGPETDRRPHPLLGSFLFWYYAASLGELESAAAVLYVLLFLVAAAWIVTRKRWLKPLTVILLLAVVAAGTSYGMKARTAGAGNEAVIVHPNTKVMSEARGRSVERFRLDEGAEVSVLRRREGWVEIQFDEKNRGWVESRRLKEI